MGKDLEKKRVLKKERQLGSPDPYRRLLVRLYTFLARRTNSAFNATVLKRLKQSRTTRAPLSLSGLARFMKSAEEGTIAVLVGTITNDERMLEVPKMSVCALRFTASARARIIKAGGECLTFDQLALRRPRGENTRLLRGPIKARTAYRYFGPAPGVPHSHTRARVRKNGVRRSKFERARGRRASRGYKA